jgi:hypothetical protein
MTPATPNPQEVLMSTQASNDTATRMSSDAAVPFRLEVVVIPVADVDRAKDFYGDCSGPRLRVVSR